MRPARTASSTTYWIAGVSTSGQHLLRLRLGRRQEPRAEPGRGDDRLPDLHRAPSLRGSRSIPAAPCARRSPPGRGVRRRPRYTRAAMPTYEYVCKRVRPALRDRPVDAGRPAHRVRRVRRRAAQGVRTRRRSSFKGSGFYATDHGKKPKTSPRPARRRTKDDVGLGVGVELGDSKSSATRQGSSTGPSESGRRTGRRAAARSGRTAGSKERTRVSRRPRSASSAARASTRSSIETETVDDRHAVRRAQRAAGDRRGRRPARGVHPAARRAARVPAAQDPLPRERVGDEGARRGAGSSGRTRAGRCSRA